MGEAGNAITASSLVLPDLSLTPAEETPLGTLHSRDGR